MHAVAVLAALALVLLEQPFSEPPRLPGLAHPAVLADAPHTEHEVDRRVGLYHPRLVDQRLAELDQSCKAGLPPTPVE